MFSEMFFYIIFLFCSFSDISIAKFSYSDLDSCTQYDTKTGYGYHDFFHVEKIKTNGSDDDILNFKFYVIAAKDAHILLSQSNQTSESSRVIEIVIGAGGNTFNEIRLQKSKKPIKTIREKNILSVIQPISFILRVTKAGLVDVKATGRNNSVINTTIENVFPIEYISFSSWGTTESKWFFDCDKDNDSDKLNKKAIKNYKSNREKLVDNLFTSIYDSSAVPQNLTEIYWNYKLKSCDFDTKLVQANSRGYFQAKWSDSRLAWNPIDYGNISILRIRSNDESSKIWMPHIRLINGVKSDYKKIEINFFINIHPNGEIAAYSNEVSVSTWCSQQTHDWPNDKVNCPIIMKFRGHYGLTFSDSSMKDMTEENQTTYLDGKQFKIVRTGYSNILDIENLALDYSYENEQKSNDKIIFQIMLQRNGALYEKLFISPLFASIVMVLLSFWTQEMPRLILNAISLLILSGMHVILAEYGPHHYVTTLVHQYNYTLIATLISTFSFILNCCMIEYNLNNGYFSSLLKKTSVRIALGLNVSKVDTIAVELKNEPKNSDLTMAIDRICFIILSLFIAIFVMF